MISGQRMMERSVILCRAVLSVNEVEIVQKKKVTVKSEIDSARMNREDAKN